ncbi:hypothetical protein ACFQXB_15400 [Plastorhodobacter daqingensis]|uniref:Uncharacterized protein n=1 Tax=Plastorhodobacter daqingensis TaxID=1387281 RepID=A0ABW2ULH4_9RHOB
MMNLRSGGSRLDDAATFDHLLWVDLLWLSRLIDAPSVRPAGECRDSERGFRVFVQAQ